MFKKICLCLICSSLTYCSAQTERQKVALAIEQQVETAVVQHSGTLASALINAAIAYISAPNAAIHTEAVTPVVAALAIARPVVPAIPVVTVAPAKPSLGKAALGVAENVVETVAIKAAEKAICPCCC